jgi:hypothetical protein
MSLFVNEEFYHITARLRPTQQKQQQAAASQEAAAAMGLR